MTNYERILSLSANEMAWLFLNDVTSSRGHGCNLCVFKDWEKCRDVPDEVRISCVNGHKQWLLRDTTEEDERLFAVARNNVVVGEYNDMDMEEARKWKVIYENGLAVRLEKDGEQNEQS